LALQYDAVGIDPPPGLVLDVNLANVSSVALDVLHAEITSPALARTNAPTRPFNVMILMIQVT